MALLPPKEWIDFSHRMIHHGRQICLARRPKCERRPLEGHLPARTSGMRIRNARYACLSGHEIRRQLGKNIVIDRSTRRNLNPNSYNLTLHDELMTYEEVVLDMAKPNRVRRMTIPPEGLVLGPNQLYLGRTVEHTETHNLVPMIEGRSSIGRLGCSCMSRPASATWVFAASGRWRCSRSSRCGFIPACRSARSSTMRSPVDHRIRQRQVPAQPRYPAEPAVQRAESRLRKGPAAQAAVWRRCSHS